MKKSEVSGCCDELLFQSAPEPQARESCVETAVIADDQTVFFDYP
jgi:hypothetical protein